LIYPTQPKTGVRAVEFAMDMNNILNIVDPAAVNGVNMSGYSNYTI